MRHAGVTDEWDCGVGGCQISIRIQFTCQENTKIEDLNKVKKHFGTREGRQGTATWRGEI